MTVDHAMTNVVHTGCGNYTKRKARAAFVDHNGKRDSDGDDKKIRESDNDGQ